MSKEKRLYDSFKWYQYQKLFFKQGILFPFLFLKWVKTISWTPGVTEKTFLSNKDVADPLLTLQLMVSKHGWAKSCPGFQRPQSNNSLQILRNW